MATLRAMERTLRRLDSSRWLHRRSGQARDLVGCVDGLSQSLPPALVLTCIPDCSSRIVLEVPRVVEGPLILVRTRPLLHSLDRDQDLDLGCSLRHLVA